MPSCQKTSRRVSGKLVIVIRETKLYSTTTTILPTLGEHCFLPVHHYLLVLWHIWLIWLYFGILVDLLNLSLLHTLSCLSFRVIYIAVQWNEVLSQWFYTGCSRLDNRENHYIAASQNPDQWEVASNWMPSPHWSGIIIIILTGITTYSQ